MADLHKAIEQAMARIETGTPCAPARDLLGDTAIDLAYAVQQCLAANRLADMT